MRILIIQSAGEHYGQDGFTKNDYLRECHALQYALEQLDNTVDIWGFGHANFAYLPEDIYDIVLCSEQYKFDWIPNLEQRFKHAVRIQWIVDLHYQKSEVYHKITNECQFILHATRCLIEEYESKFKNKTHLWFPNSVDSRYFKGDGLNSLKPINLCFVGSDHESRRKYVKGLQIDMNMEVHFLTGIDMINTIAASKIHFNKNIGCDINYRTFETIGIGTCLITNYDVDLIRLGFTDEVNCLMYKTYYECCRKITKTLHDDSWKEIARKGFELSKSHSYIQRCKDMLNDVARKV